MLEERWTLKGSDLIAASQSETRAILSICDEPLDTVGREDIQPHNVVRRRDSQIIHFGRG